MPQCWAHIWFGTEKVLIHQTRFHPSPGAQFLANCRKLMFRISRPADLACREMIFQFRHGAPWIALDVFACLFVFFFGGNRVVQLFYKKKRCYRVRDAGYLQYFEGTLQQLPIELFKASSYFCSWWQLPLACIHEFSIYVSRLTPCYNILLL